MYVASLLAVRPLFQSKFSSDVRRYLHLIVGFDFSLISVRFVSRSFELFWNQPQLSLISHLSVVTV